MLWLLGSAPVRFGHLLAVGPDPCDVLGAGAGHRRAGEEAAPTQDRIALHDPDQVADEVAQSQPDSPTSQSNQLTSLSWQ